MVPRCGLEPSISRLPGQLNILATLTDVGDDDDVYKTNMVPPGFEPGTFRV